MLLLRMLCYTDVAFGMRLFRRFSFDTIPSFRNSPFLYGLIGVVACGLGILLGAALFFQASTAPQHRETLEADAPTRTSILNILNKFHRDETASARGAPASASQSRQHIAQVITGLSSIQPSAILKVRNDLIGIFQVWDSYLAQGKDTAELRDRFLHLSSAHPWLDTMLWLIVLNRL